MIILWEFVQSSDFVLLDERFGVAEVPFWFPCVFSCGISFPSHKEGVTLGPDRDEHRLKS